MEVHDLIPFRRVPSLSVPGVPLQTPEPLTTKSIIIRRQNLSACKPSTRQVCGNLEAPIYRSRQWSSGRKHQLPFYPNVSVTNNQILPGASTFFWEGPMFAW
jgi:hypothetical protein